MSLVKTMDHTAYQKKCRTMSEHSLRYVAADAKKAADAMPDGPNNNYYTDEYLYCLQELRRRGLSTRIYQFDEKTGI